MRIPVSIAVVVALSLAVLAKEPARPKPQFQAKCSCGWSAPKSDQLDKAMKEGQAHEKAKKGHNWEIVRTNKK
jgi:hypothetical protein